MRTTSVTVEILKGIRADIQALRETTDHKIDELRDEVRVTNQRIDALTHHVVESELRTATAITDLAGSVREMTSVLRAQSDLRPRVEKCEGEIARIKQRFTGSPRR